MATAFSMAERYRTTSSASWNAVSAPSTCDSSASIFAALLFRGPRFRLPVSLANQSMWAALATRAASRTLERASASGGTFGWVFSWSTGETTGRSATASHEAKHCAETQSSVYFLFSFKFEIEFQILIIHETQIFPTLVKSEATLG